MYIYFDSNGVIKEIVNDVAIRKGSADYNKLYVHIEGNPEIDDIWYFQKFPNGSTSNEVSFINNVVIKSIPYDAKRDMTYFKDFVQYKFYVFTLTSEYLNISGLAIGTIRIAIDNSIFALGELTFNIQANEVNADNGITQSQYDYLLLAYASRTLNEQTGSDLDTLLDDKIEAKATDIIEPIFDDYKSTIDEEVEAQNETIASLSQASPSVFDTANNITVLTENKGVAVATDTGYIYYWDSTLSTPAYVSSGLQYNSLANYVKHSGSQLQDSNGNNFYPIVGDYSIEEIKLKREILNFVNYTENILNVNGIVSNTYCVQILSGGVPQINSNNSMSTYQFKVFKGITYSFTKIRLVFCHYWDSVNNTSVNFGGDSNSAYSFTPTNDGLVVLTYYNTELSNNPMIIFNGKLPTTYKPYEEKYDVSLVNEKNEQTVNISNIFDSTKVNANKYCQGFTNGIPAYGNSGDCSTFLFNVKKGVRYSLSKIRKIFCYYWDNVNETSTRLSQSDINEEYSFIPENDGQFCATIYTGFITKNQVLVIEGGYLPSIASLTNALLSSNAVFFSSFIKDFKNGVWVGANRDITTLTQAIAIAEMGFGIDVYVEDGTYDLYTELGGDTYFNSYSYSGSEYFGGIVLKNGIKLHFSPNAKVVFNYTGTNTEVMQHISAFVGGDYGFTIEGLNLECSNLRYAIHDEYNSSAIPYHNKYINCNIKFDNTGNTAWSNINCIGGGLGVSGNVIIMGCTFNSVGASDGASVVSYHNSLSGDAESNVLICNNYFLNGTIRCAYYGTSTKITKFKVSNNSLKSNPIISQENQSYTTVNVELIAWNNEIRS